MASSPASSRRGQLSTALDRILIAPLGAVDWPAAADIYEAGIALGNATFESSAPDWESWVQQRSGYPALIARDKEGAALGWAALGPVSTRAVYRGVGAVSIYVAPQQVRRGAGRALLEALIDSSERAGFWTVEAGIFPENTASVALHVSCGFRLVGVRERVGQMPDGGWRDVLLYERRSDVVGRD